MKEFGLFFIQHGANLFLNRRSETLFLGRSQFGYENRRTKTNGYSLTFDLWNMGFKNIFCVFDSYRNDWASGFCGDFKPALFERNHLTAEAPGTFRKKEYGGAGFDQLNAVEDGFKTFTNIFSVQKLEEANENPVSNQNNMYSSGSDTSIAGKIIARRMVNSAVK